MRSRPVFPDNEHERLRNIFYQGSQYCVEIQVKRRRKVLFCDPDKAFGSIRRNKDDVLFSYIFRQRILS